MTRTIPLSLAVPPRFLTREAATTPPSPLRPPARASKRSFVCGRGLQKPLLASLCEELILWSALMGAANPTVPTAASVSRYHGTPTFPPVSPPQGGKSGPPRSYRICQLRACP